jgi:hypothetical protein
MEKLYNLYRSRRTKYWIKNGRWGSETDREISKVNFLEIPQIFPPLDPEK